MESTPNKFKKLTFFFFFFFWSVLCLTTVYHALRFLEKPYRFLVAHVLSTTDSCVPVTL